MGRINAFIIKELRHILRDRRTLMILFGMPIIQILLFGFVLTNDIRQAPIAIWDLARDHESANLRNQLLSSGYFKQAAVVESKVELEQSFRRNRVKMAVVFPSGFAQDLGKEGIGVVQIVGDATDPNVASTLISYTQAIINSYQLERSVGTPNAIRIDTETRFLYNPGLKSVFGFVPGVMTLILMLVSAMMTSITIAREKELGTMEVLLASPLRPAQIIIGKAVPYLILSMLNALVVVLLGVFVFGMPLNGSPMLLAMESTLYMLVALSLGIFISTIAADQQQALFMSALGLMMPTVILSGFIFPRESMPWLLQQVGSIIPATWFNQIIKGIMIKGVGIAHLWYPTFILGMMGIIFIGLSIRNFKNKIG